ncbi:hypothetical protein [Burkholderia lata]|uniref:hypothetical protein n=1 Tax=Burkholderia lata (strain ATCC 17760 / DSM 23089 / LMG 22485 / NCIMB 9086 / R18194 / 383) TaxID=482957 RepID=UPI001581D369|nr:hypothetical protein [Burkholderia lata]
MNPIKAHSSECVVPFDETRQHVVTLGCSRTTSIKPRLHHRCRIKITTHGELFSGFFRANHELKYGTRRLTRSIGRESDAG